MQRRSSSEIRRIFLEFFAERGHRIVPSSSLVPADDPTLLFTNAGMVQFKRTFLGEEQRDYTRAASAQKCVRAGGKHNDLENVGRTARHHTFFEMLGNFSFGDYFKAEAIAFAWELLTGVFGLPKEQLWVTVFEEDDEAERLWRQETDVAPERIVRMGEKDNFWSMGETGPCGPCSEILIDQGPAFPGTLYDDGDRYLELWNLVFMQFNRDEAGNLTPLPRPSIDTGMGLERISAVLQGVESNYETDLLRPIIDHTAQLAGVRYGEDEAADFSMRVIADHARAMTFLIGDGVLPSNVGRGYVLRRIMRRAMRHANRLGFREPVLFRLADTVVERMKAPYPEIEKARHTIARVIEAEETRFLDTLDRGLRRLESAIEGMKPGDRLPGEVVFKLYDTYGFPVDLTADIVRGRGITLDEAGFAAEMEKQRQTSGGQLPGTREEKGHYRKIAQQTGETFFDGYRHLSGEGKILAILQGDTLLDRARAGEEVEIVTDATVFYGESGGQIGDSGIFTAPGGVRVRIVDTQKPLPGLIVHRGRVEAGEIAVGDRVEMRVDAPRRRSIMLNHSATHLLHAALRRILGEHVRQQGSLVHFDRLRFDFSHFGPLDPVQIHDIEELVNEEIIADETVTTELMELEEAKAAGALALFGEKYADVVRVVRIGDFSIELCGGTHVSHTGEIGYLKLTGESGISAGVRRVEAVSGPGAWRYVDRLQRELREIAEMVKAGGGNVTEKVGKILQRQKQLEQNLEALQARLSEAASNEILRNVREIGGTKVLAARVESEDPKGLRELYDRLKGRLDNAVMLLGATHDGRVMLLCGVTGAARKRFHAGKLIGQIARIVGGRGGGRPEMAQAGGNRPEALEAALEKLYEMVTERTDETRGT
ncbi:MAG: alanine--tRNA ligase [Deltaproteobacteria bacterium]|nr:MAG: alanine--tRNA ligase [Deltaproteobacteria bacterium]